MDGAYNAPAKETRSRGHFLSTGDIPDRILTISSRKHLESLLLPRHGSLPCYLHGEVRGLEASEGLLFLQLLDIRLLYPVPRVVRVGTISAMNIFEACFVG
jgi:hypothetical protein